jgi:hypothetical protein
MKNSIAQSAETERLSQIIKEKEEQLEYLKYRLSTDGLSANSSAIGQSGIFQSSDLILPIQLSDIIEREIGKRVHEIHRLYSFAEQKRYNFHEIIDRKHNILLVCLTADGTMIGAFTTAGFSHESEPSSTKAFLFGVKGKTISLSRLKAGKESVSYDTDFLIFGNDELCIERGKSVLSSYSSNALRTQLHYDPPKGEDHFLNAVGDSGMAELRNYEVFYVEFAS